MNLLDSSSSMANRNGRQVLRGAEIQVLDLMAECSTPKQWAALLKRPLERAARQGNRGLAQKLVTAGAQIGTALHEAVGGGHGELVNDLLERGVYIDVKDTASGRTALHVAAREGRTEMVELLMLKGADKDSFDKKKSTPLDTAVCLGHVTTALALLAGGADVNTPCGGSSQSVLHIAAEKGHVEVLRAAIERGADVNAIQLGERTALHVAAGYNKPEAIDALVDAGADVEAWDSTGWMPLHCAALGLNLEAVTALLKYDPDPNAQDDSLETPLHFAATQAKSQGAAEVIDVLLRAGAYENLLNERNESVHDVVAAELQDEVLVTEDIERVQKLLANAPADRAWRRRGYLVLCRAHPDRVQQAQGSSSAGAGMPRRALRGAKARRPGALGCSNGGTCARGGTEAGWEGVAARVLGLQEEGIFRMIVGYL